MVNSLTEDAVNAACLGFDHQTVRRKRKGKASNGDPALLNLSIDEAQNPDWLLCIPKGSWKRICLNLVLNALKYTPSGYISVTLRKKWAQKKAGSEQTALVELIVGLIPASRFTDRLILISDHRLKTPALECQKSFKPKVFSDHSNKRTAWPPVLDL